MERDDNVEYSEENVKRFLNEYAVKVAEEEVRKLLE